MDLKLAWMGDFADLVYDDVDLGTDEGLITASIISLFSDAPAQTGDFVPPGSEHRGFWADSFAGDGRITGSRLWLLDYRKATGNVLKDARLYAQEALEWMVTDKVAKSVHVVATRQGSHLMLNVVIRRPDGKDVEMKYQSVWEGTLNAI